MDCYATLWSSWIKAGDGFLEYLLQRGLKPEIGLEHGGFDLPLARHREVAARFRDQGLSPAVHLPFTGIRPGTETAAKWNRGRDLMLRALDIAACYEPDHLIGHPEFRPGLDSLSSIRRVGPGLAAAKHQPSETWLAQSARFWSEVLEHSPARLYLENTADQSPAAIVALLEILPGRAAMCFDLGHWFSAADGLSLKNLPQWLELTAGRVEHLHLHDNHGHYDEHLGLGFGLVDLNLFLELLARHGLRPTYTLEAHHRSDLNQSLAVLAGLPADSPLFRSKGNL